jgi:hypothetical protein
MTDLAMIHHTFINGGENIEYDIFVDHHPVTGTRVGNMCDHFTYGGRLDRYKGVQVERYDHADLDGFKYIGDGQGHTYVVFAVETP